MQARRIEQGDYTTSYIKSRYDEIGTLINAFNKMINSISKKNQEITFLAYHDSLTNLPNRDNFTKNINELIVASRGREELSIYFVDLDEFKLINDTFGHHAGDDLLCTISERLTNLLQSYEIASCRSNSYIDSLIARIGGDEFLICIPNVKSEQDINRIAEKFIELIQKPIDINGEQVMVAGSIGIAVYPHHGDNAEELITNADMAMYHAKNNGKNTFKRFNSGLYDAVKKRMDIEADLRKSLVTCEDFELVYQPQVSMKNSLSVSGAEALIRWNHPLKGKVFPNDFISIAEATGLIIPIGDWVIYSACRQICKWRDVIGTPFSIAVNLSAKQIYNPNSIETIRKAVQELGIRPGELHVEVTESLLMKDEIIARDVIDEIRSLGVLVWLDDFGTGYSSLSLLRSFNIDGVKVDKSFIGDLDYNLFDQALTSSVIKLAKSLNILVVAEGVETKDQERFLLDQQCDIAQGYLYAHPLPPSDFEQRYAETPKSRTSVADINPN